VTTVNYDEADDTYGFHCHDCGRDGPRRDAQRDAWLDADRHDELHDDGVITH
jgi:hypothetical protein